ncbi:MAG: HdeD family acid-resistance protein [Aliidongia sp.]
MFPSQASGNSGRSAVFTRSVHEHWRLFLAEGIVLSLLGLAAFLVPLVAGILATTLFGWLLLIAGAAGLISSIRTRQAPGFGWSLLSAFVAVIAGLVLLWNPLQGLMTLTYVLTAFFVADGILMILLATTYRRLLSGRWEWMMANGVIDLILAGIVILGLPGTPAWMVGLLVGIDLMFGGGSLIAMALGARLAHAASSARRGA